MRSWDTFTACAPLGGAWPGVHVVKSVSPATTVNSDGGSGVVPVATQCAAVRTTRGPSTEPPHPALRPSLYTYTCHGTEVIAVGVPLMIVGCTPCAPAAPVRSQQASTPAMPVRAEKIRCTRPIC